MSYLDLNKNKITDVSALAELTKLKTLILNGNEIKDISVLEKIEKEGCTITSDPVKEDTSNKTDESTSKN